MIGYTGYGGVERVARALQAQKKQQAQPDYTQLSDAASRERNIADALTQRALNTGPIQHWAQGAAGLGEAFLARRANQKAEAAEGAAYEARDNVVRAILAGSNPQIQQLGQIDLGAALQMQNQEQQNAYRQTRDARADAEADRRFDLASTQHADVVAHRDRSHEYQIQSDDRSFAARQQQSARANQLAERRVALQENDAAREAAIAFQASAPAPPPAFDGGFWDWHSPGQNLGAEFIQADFTDGLPESAPKQTLSSVGQYSKSRGKRAGKGDAQRLQDIQQSSSDLINRSELALDEMEYLLEQGAPIGPFAEQRSALSRVGMGFLPFVPDQEKGALLDAFEGPTMVLTLANVALTKGAISNSEMELFRRSVANWGQTPQGAKQLIDFQKRLNERVSQHAEAAAAWDYRYGGLSIPDESGRTFDKAWADYARETPFNVNPTASQLPDGVSPAHVDALRANPDRAAEFDAKFGEGAAALILNGG